MKNYSPQELLEFDGKNGRRAFIAFNGKVYDVTDSPKWRNGVHFKAHPAGIDLSNAIQTSPHGSEVFVDLPIVGDFDAEENVSTLKRFFVRTANRHVHSICSHFSVSSFALAPVILIISIIFPHWKHLESLSSQLLLIGFLSLPFSISTGIIDWWVKYSFDLTGLIKKKLLFSLFLFLVSTIIVSWRFFNPHILFVDSSFLALYLCLNFFAFFCNAILGKVGGELTFSSLSLENWFTGKHSAQIEELLKMAVIRERESQYFYKKLGKQVNNHDQAAVLEFLMHQEKMHEAKIENIIEDITKGEMKPEKSPK